MDCMNSKQGSIVNIEILSGLVDFSAFIIMFSLLDWNFFVAFVISEIIGWSIRLAWAKGKTNPETAAEVYDFVNRWWWGIAFLAILPVILGLAAAPVHLKPFDYVFGEIFILVVLAFVGVITWKEGSKFRAVLFFISCLGWMLLAVDMLTFGGYENNAIERIREHEVSTTVMLYATIGFAGIAFIWSLIRSLAKNRLNKPAS